MKNSAGTNNQGFTLLEILLVIAIIAILAGIVIFAINPGRQLAQARNAQRKVDVNTILNAVYQYALDNQGNFITNIPPPEESGISCLEREDIEICKTGFTDSCGLDLSGLTQNGRYLVSIPNDPSGFAFSPNGSGYSIQRTSDNRITVCAPNAELDETVSVSR